MALKIQEMKVLVVLFVFFTNGVLSNPKKYEAENGFEPSHRYYESDIDDFRAGSKNRTMEDYARPADRKQDAKESRFGIIPITSYDGAGGAQYGGGGGGGVQYAMSPLKLDLGGVALGALIGLGAVLILPKIAHIFSGGLGYRALETELSPVTDMLARIDNSLEQNNIDSSSCIQRMICSYVSDAEKNINNGESSSLNEFVHSVTNNTLFSYAFDGSAVKQAAEVGKGADSEKCTSSFSRCPVTKETVLKVIANLLPA